MKIKKNHIIGISIFVFLWGLFSTIFKTSPYKYAIKQLHTRNTEKDEEIKLYKVELQKFKDSIANELKLSQKRYDSVQRIYEWRINKIKYKLNELQVLNNEAQKKIQDASDDSIDELRDSIFARLERIQQIEREMQRTNSDTIPNHQ